MKNLLLFLLLPVFASAQIKTFSPSGSRVSYTPSTSIIGSTAETTLFTEVIPANSLVPGKYYPFRVDMAITTPLINLSTLTFRVYYGGTAIAVINGAGLTIGMTNAIPVTLTGNLVSRSANSQFLPITLSQAITNALSLTTSNTTARGLYSIDSTLDQTFTITAQFGGVGGASCTLVTDWVLRSDF